MQLSRIPARDGIEFLGTGRNRNDGIDPRLEYDVVPGFDGFSHVSTRPSGKTFTFENRLRGWGTYMRPEKNGFIDIRRFPSQLACSP